MTRTISARVNNDLHTKLVEVCNDLGMSMNELLNNWIKEQIKFHSEAMQDPEYRKEITVENI